MKNYTPEDLSEIRRKLQKVAIELGQLQDDDSLEDQDQSPDFFSRPEVAAKVKELYSLGHQQRKISGVLKASKTEQMTTEEDESKDDKLPDIPLSPNRPETIERLRQEERS